MWLKPKAKWAKAQIQFSIFILVLKHEAIHKALNNSTLNNFIQFSIKQSNNITIQQVNLVIYKNLKSQI